jgi:hypothetical protein
MKRFLLTLTMVAAALIATVGLADAAGTWGNAQTVTGFDAIGGTGDSNGSLIMCSAPGTCTVFGEYVTGNNYRAFTAVETNGVWGAASVIPSLDTLSAGSDVFFEFYDCASQNSCVIAGLYGDGVGSKGFVYDTATDTAIEIPGLAALDVGLYTNVSSISCSSQGNCSLVGSYFDVSNVFQAFTVDQVDGVWQSATPVTGMSSGGALNSVSCWADGECVAIGIDTGGSNDPVVVTRSGGTWGGAEAIPGISGLSSAGGEGWAVSCSTGPVCVAVGTLDSPGASPIFVTSLANGVWSDASQLPSFTALTFWQFPGINALSCWTPGNCLLSGTYNDAGIEKAWTAELVSGVWQSAVPAPGMDALSTNAFGLTGQSCASDGSCALVGYYDDGTNYQGFVFNRNADGTWSDAQPIPGLAALNIGGYGDPQDVSCVVGGCSATGWYQPSANGTAAFVVDMVTTPEPTPEPIAPAFTG